MRRDSPLVAILLILVSFGLIWFGLSRVASSQVDAGSWVSPAVLGSGDTAEEVDPFAAGPAVDPFDSAGAGGTTSVDLDVAKDALKAALSKHLLWFIGFAALLAIIWVVLCWRRKQTHNLIAEETALLPAWVILFILLLVGAAGIALFASGDSSIENYLASDAGLIITAAATLLAALAFWANTASATPNSLRRSVPGHGAFPLHGASSR